MVAILQLKASKLIVYVVSFKVVILTILKNFWIPCSVFTMPFLGTINVHTQFVAVISSETSARDFLISEGLLHSSLSCSTSACGKQMELKVCSASKSPDLLHWWCSSCHRSNAIRSGSLLSGKKITFVNLSFWSLVKGLGGSSISGLSDLSEDTVSAWRKIWTDEVTCWFIRTSKPIGGEGWSITVEQREQRAGF